MAFTKGVGPRGIAEPNSSGITAIVVGLGLGGLAFAIEATRKGHRVIAVDQQPELKPIGDSIAIPNNAALVIRQWDNGLVDEQLQDSIAHCDVMEIHNSDGELLLNSSMVGYGKGAGYPAHRGRLAMVLYEYAKKLGVEFHLGHRILDYFENDNEAGIILDGKRIIADCVIGADGVHSKSRGKVIGMDPTPHSSGYAIYRAYWDAEPLRKDPEAQWFFETPSNIDSCKIWLGEDAHVLTGTTAKGKYLFLNLTHKDDYNVTESWAFPGNSEEMYRYFESWSAAPMIRQVLDTIPPGKLIDYKLLWRDPLPTWVSPKKRMIIIGDAAHPVLPTSGQGGGQAIEDAATLAIALELAGKENIPLALSVTEAIRYERACLMQKIGVDTRNIWHKTNWQDKSSDRDEATLPRPDWIFNHDCQEYAYENFDEVAEVLQKGGKYQPRNIPEDLSTYRKSNFRL